MIVKTRFVNNLPMLTDVSDSDHHKEVLSRVQSVKQTLWIGTADIKDQDFCPDPIA